MSNLKESLLNTLKGVNSAFDAARADLQQLVAETNEAVKAADSRLTARVVEIEKNTDGVTYAVIIASGTSSQVVAYYKISPNGYPILSASSTSDLQISYAAERLNDKDLLTTHFQKMSDERNSPLIAAVAYMMRKI